MGLLDDLLGQLGGGAGRNPQPRPQPTSVGANTGMGRILMALLPVVLSMLARRGQAGGRRTSDLAPGGTGGGGGGLGDILGDVLGGGAGAGAGRRGGGGLGDVLGDVLGGGAGAGGAGGGMGGGLGDLLEQFKRAGFGQQAQSWVSTGANQAVPPDAMEKVFGPGALQEIARQAGLSQQETAQGLAQLLPEVVDKVTPDGTVPDPNTLLESVQALGRRVNPPSGA